MIDETLAVLAIRTRAVSLVAATTGSATLEATAEGYARASGSFITDGFRVGQDVTPVGFTQVTPGVITARDALTMTIAGGRTVQTSGAGRSLVSGLPTMRAFELVGDTGMGSSFTPVVGRPYVTDKWVPGGGGMTTWPDSNGRLEEDFLSIWTWYGLAGVGIAAIRKGVFAFKKLFASGTIVTLGDGTSVRVRGRNAIPRSGEIIPLNGGFAACQITIPLRAWTRNVIAA